MGDLDAILDRLQRTLGPLDGAPVPLDGGITNRNFRASFGNRLYVVRLPGKDTSLLGISREAERVAGELAASLGVAPELVAAEPECMVTAWVDGGPIDPDWLRSAPDGVGRALRAVHDSGAELPTRFWVPELLEDYAGIVRERGGSLPPAYTRTRALASRIAAALPLDQPVPCHCDLLPGNLMQVETADGPRVMLVDWEYAGMGHRYFDLGNLAVNNEFDEDAETRLLAAYLGRPPTAAQRAALSLMKIMSDAREAAWGVIQAVVSELDFDFDDYAESHFTRLTAAAADPRLERWLAIAAP